jgi:hypothetical protein
MNQSSGGYRHFKITFSDYSTILGLLVNALAVFSLVKKLFTLTPLGFVRFISEVYVKVFHGIADLLLFWVPYQISPWLKDIFIIWSIFAAITTRTILRVRSIDRSKFEDSGRLKRPWFYRIYTKYPILSYVIGYFVWPVVLCSIIRNGYLMLTPSQSYRQQPVGFFVPGSIEEINLRVVFLLQIAAMFTACAVLIVFNST